MPAATAWPAAIADTPAIAVIERAISNSRLPHSLLLQGEDMAMLEAIALGMADRILNTPASSAHFAPEQHPDCFHLRPAKKMRQIGADATRDLIAKVQMSPAVSPSKVAIMHEADRLHETAANVFLKTLEEPPRGTTIILLTSRPYSLLPTIRSRVQTFRFSVNAGPLEARGWAEWMQDYQAWLGRLCAGTGNKQSAADHLFSLYGLLARFALVLDQATSVIWEQQKKGLPEDLKEEEKDAIETGIANGIRARLFADIERATRAFALPHMNQGNGGIRRPLTATVDALEHSFRLLALNLNENTALEDFLLATLRIWTKR